MDFKNGSKNIQAAGYHGARTVTNDFQYLNKRPKDYKTTKTRL